MQTLAWWWWTEVFDLASDPCEIKDLASDTAVTAMLAAANPTIKARTDFYLRRVPENSTT